MTTFNNSFSHDIWEQTYKHHSDNSIDDTLRRVAKAIASVEDKDKRDEWEKKFYDMLTDFKVTVGGRIYSNAGTEWEGTTLINCFVSPKPSNPIDSIEGIYEILLDQTKTLKSEGGWGHNFSHIRPRGSFIYKIGIESPGAVKFMEIFDKSSEVITSGSGLKSQNIFSKGKIRKGAMMGILDCWHPDILEFITSKQIPGRLTKFNISVNCTDEFCDKIVAINRINNGEFSEEEKEKLKNGVSVEDLIKEYDQWDLIFPETTFEKYDSEWDGDIKKWKEKNYPIKVYKTISASYLWNTILESTYNRAEPGVVFLDRANEYYSSNYMSKIVACNPCLPGYVTIQTQEGPRKISSLLGKKVTFSINNNFYDSTDVGFFKTSDFKGVYRCRTKEGFYVDLTKDHKVGVFENNKLCWKEAAKLIHGDKIVLNKNVNKWNGKYSFEEGYTKSKEFNENNDFEIFNELLEYSFEGTKGFLIGIFEKFGSISFYPSLTLTLKNLPKYFLIEIQRILLRVGVYSIINKENVLVVSNKNLYRFLKISNKSNDTNLNKEENLKETTDVYDDENILYLATFEELEYLGNMEVYDCQVPKVNCFDANGILVHNCGEQMLPHGGSCNLSSLNLTQLIDENSRSFDFEKIRKYTKYLVRFLDNVNSYTNLPLPEYEDFVRNLRRIGIGVMGWGSALFMLKIKYGSKEANELRDKLMETISVAAHEASIDLAEERGMFRGCDPIKHSQTKYIKSLPLSEEYIEKLKKFGIRNSSLLSCQPTGNTSILANIVSGGIEPIFMYEYIRTSIVPSCPEDLLDKVPKYWQGEFHETDYFKFTKEGDEEILKYDDGKTVYKIDKNRGLTKEVVCEDYSVKYLKNRGEWDPNGEWCVTALNGLNVEDHINDMTGFARWIDSAISKTINVPYEYSFDDFKKVYLDAYKKKYIKGITTYRSGTMTAVLSSIEKENNKEDEEIILDDIKFPNNTPAKMRILKAENRKWYVTVIFDPIENKNPIAFFVHTNHPEKNITTNNSLEILFDLAEKKGIPKKFIESTKNKIQNDNNPTKIARTISLLLRHGVKPKSIVQELEAIDNLPVTSFLFQIKKLLGSFIKNGTKVDQLCKNCGSKNVVFQEGCIICLDCGNSKC